MEKMDVVYKRISNDLNRIPFVNVISYNPVHFGSGELFGVRSNEQQMFLYGGNIFFNVNGSYEKARNFLFEMKGLEEYPFVNVKKHGCGNRDCNLEGSFALYLDNSDLTHAAAINNDDDLEIITKKTYQVEREAGFKRLNEYRDFWNDLLAIADKYIE